MKNCNWTEIFCLILKGFSVFRKVEISTENMDKCMICLLTSLISLPKSVSNFSRINEVDRYMNQYYCSSYLADCSFFFPIFFEKLEVLYFCLSKNLLQLYKDIIIISTFDRNDSFGVKCYYCSHVFSHQVICPIRQILQKISSSLFGGAIWRKRGSGGGITIFCTPSLRSGAPNIDFACANCTKM